jgi:hypothetical protein
MQSLTKTSAVIIYSALIILHYFSCRLRGQSPKNPPLSFLKSKARRILYAFRHSEDEVGIIRLYRSEEAEPKEALLEIDIRSFAIAQDDRRVARDDICSAQDDSTSLRMTR